MNWLILIAIYYVIGIAISLRPACTKHKVTWEGDPERARRAFNEAACWPKIFVTTKIGSISITIALLVSIVIGLILA